MGLQKVVKKDDFKHGRMFGRASKIPIANTFSELVEMDFRIVGILQLSCAFEILFHVSR